MTAHEIANMASWLPEGLSEAQISEINEEAIPINTKKATKFSLDVFQGRVLFLKFVVRLNFTKKNMAQKYEDCNFFFTDSLVRIC